MNLLETIAPDRIAVPGLAWDYPPLGRKPLPGGEGIHVVVPPRVVNSAWWPSALSDLARRPSFCVSQSSRARSRTCAPLCETHLSGCAG